MSITLHLQPPSACFRFMNKGWERCLCGHYVKADLSLYHDSLLVNSSDQPCRCTSGEDQPVPSGRLSALVSLLSERRQEFVLSVENMFWNWIYFVCPSNFSQQRFSWTHYMLSHMALASDHANFFTVKAVGHS